MRTSAPHCHILLPDPKPGEGALRYLSEGGIVTWSQFPVTVRPRPLTGKRVHRTHNGPNNSTSSKPSQSNPSDNDAEQAATHRPHMAHVLDLREYEAFMLNVLNKKENVNSADALLGQSVNNRMENSSSSPVLAAVNEFPTTRSDAIRPASAAFPTRPILTGSMRTRAGGIPHQHRPLSSQRHPPPPAASGIVFHPPYDYIADTEDASHDLNPQEEEELYEELFAKKTRPKRNAKSAVLLRPKSTQLQHLGLQRPAVHYDNDDTLQQLAANKNLPAVVRQCLSLEVTPHPTSMHRKFPIEEAYTHSDVLNQRKLRLRSTSARLYLGSTVLKPPLLEQNYRASAYVMTALSKPITSRPSSAVWLTRNRLKQQKTSQ